MPACRANAWIEAAWSVWSRKFHVVSVKRRSPTRERSRANSTGPTSRGSPATQTVRSDAAGESWMPVTRFQATGSPVAAVPTPADHLQAVWRAC